MRRTARGGGGAVLAILSRAVDRTNAIMLLADDTELGDAARDLAADLVTAHRLARRVGCGLTDEIAVALTGARDLALTAGRGAVSAGAVGADVKMAHAHAYVTSEASWPHAAGGKLMPPAGAVIVADGASDILLVNPATERLLGRTANKLIGSRLTDRLRRADGSAWSEQDWPVPQPLGSRRCTPAVPMLAIRGDLTLPVAVVTMPLPSAQHGPHRMVVSILETAKPRKPGRRPRQARRWPEEPMAVAGRWDWQLDGHGRATAVSWNDEMYRLVGLAPRSAPINGERYLRTIHPDDQARVYEVGQHAFTMGGDVDHVHRVVLPTGQVRYLHITGTTELGAHGRPVRAWGTARISHSPSAQPHRTETAPASARFPIWIATRILPTAQRPRYIEEFNAELAEQPRRQRTPYTLRLIGRSLALQRSLRTTHPRPEDRQ